MKTRSVLVRCPGFPFTLRSLMPSRHAAALAASLLESGHETVVCDFGTVETLDRLFCDGLRTVAQPIAGGLLENPAEEPAPTVSTLWQWRNFDRALHASQESLCAGIAAGIAAERAIDFVAFEIDTASEVWIALSIAGHLAEAAPSIRLVAVGAFAERYGGSLIQVTDLFDCACLGDAEWTLVQWAENIDRPESWRSLPNLAYMLSDHAHVTHRPNDLDIDALPLPCYAPEIYPALAQAGKLKLFDVEDSRGCAALCHRCEQPARATNGFRMRPAASVCDEMASVVESCDSRAFLLSSPGTSSAHAEALAHEILARRQQVCYGRTGQVRHMDACGFSALKKSGCRAVSFRIDTGSQRLLEDYYGRSFSVTQAEQLLRACAESGIFTAASFTYPCPADDYHTEAETLRLIERTRPRAASLGLPEVIPGSAWYERPADFGFALDTRRYVQNVARGARSFFSLLPFCRPRPYLMASYSWAQAVRKNHELRGQVSALGIATGLSGPLALVAGLAGHGAREEEFSGLLRYQLFVGAVSCLADTLARFNDQAAARVGAMGLKPFVPDLKAVGN